jgi:hypothetical protein
MFNAYAWSSSGFICSTLFIFGTLFPMPEPARECTDFLDPLVSVIARAIS